VVRRGDDVDSRSRVGSAPVPKLTRVGESPTRMANASATVPSIRVGPCAAALSHSWCAADCCEHALTAATRVFQDAPILDSGVHFIGGVTRNGRA
jgi:hypothetical protein